MRNRHRSFAVAALFVGIAVQGSSLQAQWPPLSMPQPSPAASVSQTVGISKVTIEYARPRVNGRKVWGELVPYGEVWRAGANMNTTITFSSPVEVAGRSLPAGKYGLHMLPTEKEWTAIFSRDHERWGSFGYEEKNDALRVQVTPGSGPMTESLAYSFDAITGDSAEIVLQWETLRLAIPVKFDTKSEVVAALRADLTGLPQFFWQPWNTAANYCINNQVNLDEAERWIARSIEINENFINSKTRAKLLRLRGDAAGADALIAKALASATEAEVNQHGYDLLGERKLEEAIAIFRRNVKNHPQSWNAQDSLGEGLAAAGKTAEAIAAYRKALAMAPENQKARIEGILGRLGKS
jgi:hypothetical protein